MKIYTVGFTKKSARTFFGLMEDSGTTRLVDVRLNNISQLAGFAKRDDLSFFLEKIVGMSYEHVPKLAPTQEMLDDYKKHGMDWSAYEGKFIDLLRHRQVERTLSPDLVDNAVLLCSEAKADHCHRRLVAEYLRDTWGDVDICHLG